MSVKLLSSTIIDLEMHVADSPKLIVVVKSKLATVFSKFKIFDICNY